MADHGEVKIRQGKIDDLIKVYRQTYKDITETIVGSTEAGRIQKARVMATIKAQLKDLGDDVDKWAKANIAQYYLDGANTAIQDLRALGVDLTKTSGLAAVNKAAIEAMVSETSGALFEAITGIQRNAGNIISYGVRQQTNFTIAEGKLKGEALKTVSGLVSSRIKDEGIDALVDSAGRSWSFERYAEMLVRTKGVEARNQGMANRMLQNGYDLVQVSNHGSSHPACAEWEGQILSITGDTPGYPTLSEAESDGLFHPNCQHAINPINPDIAELTNMYDNPFNYDDVGADDIEFPGPGAAGVATQHIPVFHGGGAGYFPKDNTDLFGNAFYVSRTQSVAKEFGSKVSKATLNIKPSLILTIATDTEYNELIRQAIKAYPGTDIQLAIPKFVRSKGYSAIEGTSGYDPLAGIAIFDKNLLK